MNKNILLELAKKYLEGTATEAEKQALHQWYDQADNEEIEDVFSTQQESADSVQDRIFSRIRQQMHAGQEEYVQQRISSIPVIKRRKPAAWLAAAVIAGIIICGAVLWLTRSDNNKIIADNGKPAPAAKQGDVPAGGDKAKLVLGDGRVVILEDVKDGAIQATPGITINKKNGQLLYDASASSAKAAAVAFNTISTPRGGQYHVILPDGTKVWLNASSSLHFPTAFTGKERRVELTGEAYFEVAKNKQMPFKVFVPPSAEGAAGGEIEVLGTHFNIMGYQDEGVMKTTLLEGSVKITAGSGSELTARNSKLLSPGQQATISTKSSKSSEIQVQTANIEEAIAWKNGIFQFNKTEIPAIMRQISRWYDVEITYESNMPSRYFSGDIPRDVPLSKMLQLLQLGDIHCRLEGKRLIVLD